MLKAAVVLLTPNLCKPSLGEETLLLKCPSSQCAFCFMLEQDRVEETGELGIQLGPQGCRRCSPHAVPRLQAQRQLFVSRRPCDGCSMGLECLPGEEVNVTVTRQIAPPTVHVLS